MPAGHRPEIELPYARGVRAVPQRALAVLDEGARVPRRAAHPVREPPRRSDRDRRLREHPAVVPRRQSGRHRPGARPPGAPGLRVARADPLRRAARADREPVARAGGSRAARSDGALDRSLVAHRRPDQPGRAERRQRDPRPDAAAVRDDDRGHPVPAHPRGRAVPLRQAPSADVLHHEGDRRRGGSTAWCRS